jgi:hypothetical protein
LNYCLFFVAPPQREATKSLMVQIVPVLSRVPFNSWIWCAGTSQIFDQQLSPRADMLDDWEIDLLCGAPHARGLRLILCIGGRI